MNKLFGMIALLLVSIISAETVNTSVGNVGNVGHDTAKQLNIQYTVVSYKMSSTEFNKLLASYNLSKLPTTNNLQANNIVKANLIDNSVYERLKQELPQALHNEIQGGTRCGMPHGTCGGGGSAMIENNGEKISQTILLMINTNAVTPNDVNALVSINATGADKTQPTAVSSQAKANLQHVKIPGNYVIISQDKHGDSLSGQIILLSVSK